MVLISCRTAWYVILRMRRAHSGRELQIYDRAELKTGAWILCYFGVGVKTTLL